MRATLLLLQRHQGHTRVLGSLQGLTASVSASVSSQTVVSPRTRARSTLSKPSFKRSLHQTRPAFGGANPIHLNLLFKSAVAGPTPVSSEDEERKQEQAVVSSSAASKNKAFALDLGLPKLIPEWRNMFKAETLFADISAGLTVGCIAVPLSLAIAVASGVPAEVGLVTAAVSGIAGGLMGGTTLAVTGPAAAISLLVIGAVQQHGLEALPFITLACGGLQMASGVTRLGVVAKLVPVSVIAGFTTGVGTLILTGQLPKAMGMAAPAGLSPVEVLSFIGEHASMINPSAAALAAGTSAAMWGLPKIHKKMPSALLAVGGATLATHTMGLDVSLIGAIPSGLSAFQFGIPMIPSMDALPSLTATVLVIYAMTSVESLLSCAALEKMKKTSYKYNPDQELVGQGLANVTSAFFMGMPVTSVIARSGLNVRVGAETRLPALVQAGFVFSSVVLFSDKIAMIPMPALSGMLLMTGMGMLNPTEFQHCFAVQKLDALPFVATVGGMLSLGLAEGIGIGCASAVALHYARSKHVGDVVTKMQVHEVAPMPDMSTTTIIHHQDHTWHPQSSNGPVHALNSNTKNSDDNPNPTHARKVHTSTAVCPTRNSIWKIQGPITFVSMFEIDAMMRQIQERTLSGTTDAVVLDMHGVTSLEFTGVEELITRLLEAADGTPIHLLNCHESLLSALDLCDPSEHIQRSPLPTTSPTPAAAASTSSTR